MSRGPALTSGFRHDVAFDFRSGLLVVSERELMTSPVRHHHHHHHQPQTEPHQLGRLHQLCADMSSSSSTSDLARWFRDDEYRGCQPPVHRHSNGYAPSPFFQPQPQQRRPNPAAVSGPTWPSTTAPWSRHAGGTPPWTPAGSGHHRPGYRGLEAWPHVVENTVSPIFNNHDLHHQPHHQQQQQPCSLSPDDVAASLQTHKYPWMSIIGMFNSR